MSPPDSIQERVTLNNANVFINLIKQLRSPLGVIPFLGAGVSAPLKYKQWGHFLTGVAQQLKAVDRAEVEKTVKDEDYLRAAGLLAQRLGAPYFQKAMADEFSEDRLRDADLSAGMYGYLPLIATGPVITTNFDRVTEHVFAAAGRRFEDQVYGANPDQVVPAIQENRRILWKIHGDYLDSRTRVFSEEEYQRHYRDLPKLLQIALLNRPALFIGSSLETDRTTDVLRTIYSEYPGIFHYAFMQTPETEDEFDQRVEALRNMSVLPLWYPKGKHQQITQWMSDLVHEMSSVPLARARRERPKDEPVANEEKGVWFLNRELSEVEIQLQTVKKKLLHYSAAEPPYAVIVDKMARGEMAFFLGASVTMDRLPLGDQFYSDLMMHIDPHMGAVGSSPKYGKMPQKRITQHFADKHGRKVLYSRVAHQLARKGPEPTAIHWFIATLTARLRAKNYTPAPLWILTTNYDDWMEYALRFVNQPFHLFTYRVNDPHGGSFIYQNANGDVRVIDRSSRFCRLPQDFPVVVKLHGGVHRDIDLPTSYVFTQRDFVELGGKMPGAIPQVLLDGLAKRSLFFLGSGLNDDSIEAIVRHGHESDPRKLSWAIQFPAQAENKLYWDELGVQIIDIPQERLILELNREIESLLPSPV